MAGTRILTQVAVSRVAMPFSIAGVAELGLCHVDTLGARGLAGRGFG